MLVLCCYTGVLCDTKILYFDFTIPRMNGVVCIKTMYSKQNFKNLQSSSNSQTNLVKWLLIVFIKSHRVIISFSKKLTTYFYSKYSIGTVLIIAYQLAYITKLYFKVNFTISTSLGLVQHI